jgi:hypothetical protein
MKMTRLAASFGLALIFLLTMIVPAMAKPVDSGMFEFGTDQWIVDTSGNHWVIDCRDWADPNYLDYIYLDCYTPNWGTELVNIDSSLNASYEYNSSVNMRRGTAKLVNPYVNLTVTASGNKSYYSSGGSHKEGSWWTAYGDGPGSLKGTITVNSTVYTFNYASTSDFLFLSDFHYITK